MKKILFINPHRDPLFSSTISGGANRSQMFLRALTQIGHVDVIPFIDNEKSNIDNCDVKYSQHPTFAQTPQYGRVEKFFRLFAFGSDNSIYPINKSIEDFLDNCISNEEYDYIATRYLHIAATFGLLKYSNRLILDVDDNPSKTLLLEAKNARSWKKRLYYKFSSAVAAINSRIVLKKVQYVFYSNEEECPSPKGVFLPNVSVLKDALLPVSEQTPYSVLVVGIWSYAPNKNGLRRFLTNVWPEVKSMVPKAELRVVGKNMDDELLKICRHAPGVVALGFVDDLTKEYNDARCVVIPIYDGTGTCVKTIETISVNRPFVSTSCGVRGLSKDLQSQKDYLLANTDKEFIEHVVLLLSHPEYGAELANNALQIAKKKWSEERFNEIVIQNVK